MDFWGGPAVIIKLGRLRVSIGRGVALVLITDPALPGYSLGVWGLTWGYQAHMDETYTSVFWGRREMREILAS